MGVGVGTGVAVWFGVTLAVEETVGVAVTVAVWNVGVWVTVGEGDAGVKAVVVGSGVCVLVAVIL
jgi:hypothetical protein